jgi:FtsP/CotA-like multicopper oxidase with cupredoxin domain
MSPSPLCTAALLMTIIKSSVPLWLLMVLAGPVPSLAASPASLAPPGWDADIKLAEAPDRNPDPAVVEIDITARIAEVEVAGTRVRAWTYNGGVPGPLIRTKVGDRLIVHFTNELDEPTTLHFHGVRVPNNMDGVPGTSQPEVKKGERFTYDFVVRDPSLYWYHPHVMSAAQVGYGLYGALLVEDPADGVDVADQLTLVLSDIGFDKTGTLESAESGGSAGMVFGREGGVVLVNGRSQPVLRARAGAPQRWRIVNAAKSRFFYLDLDGQTFTVIGQDGGLQERPVASDILLVTPGERVDVIVAPTGAPGSSVTLRAMLYNRGYGSIEYRSVEDHLSVAFSADAPMPKFAAPTVSRELTPPPLAGATPVAMVLTLPPQEAGHSEFRINGVPYWKATPFTAALGETQIWTVRNETDWDHPYHLHGYFFMVLDERGQPVAPRVWKDTVNVPMKSTVRIAVTFDERPGEWMIHCHILDHAEGGLMGTVRVGDGPTGTHTHSAPKKPQ